VEHAAAARLVDPHRFRIVVDPLLGRSAERLETRHRRPHQRLRLLVRRHRHMLEAREFQAAGEERELLGRSVSADHLHHPEIELRKLPRQTIEAHQRLHRHRRRTQTLHQREERRIATRVPPRPRLAQDLRRRHAGPIPQQGDGALSIGCRLRRRSGTAHRALVASHLRRTGRRLSQDVAHRPFAAVAQARDLVMGKAGFGVMMDLQTRHDGDHLLASCGGRNLPPRAKRPSRRRGEDPARISGTQAARISGIHRSLCAAMN
jgi:hypothetical protein